MVNEAITCLLSFISYKHYSVHVCLLWLMQSHHYIECASRYMLSMFYASRLPCNTFKSYLSFVGNGFRGRITDLVGGNCAGCNTHKAHKRMRSTKRRWSASGRRAQEMRCEDMKDTRWRPIIFFGPKWILIMLYWDIIFWAWINM